MNRLTLEDLPVQNLEYIFSPPGLPLVAKTEGGIATTSILVRGGAGTGKTTLAVGLGQAIARRGEGAVLYLTTEFSQTELLYKASLLGLPGISVLPWNERSSAKSGDIVAEHLALRPAGEGPLTSSERKAGAIETLWELLHPDEPSALGVDVRAVVLDAFTLPDANTDEKTLRSDLVALVQALEGEGISTVIVEESPGGETSWLPFVVDIVFELQWLADPDSGEYHRKLWCSKSRYAQSLAGPHDYGLALDVPAVWPDLLAVASVPSSRAKLAAKQPARVFLPIASGTRGYVSLIQGGVLLTSRKHRNLAAKILEHTPGAKLVDVHCGSVNVISGETLEEPIRTPDAEGAQSLGWALLRLVRERGVNVVVLHDPEALLRRKRFEVPLLHVIEALRYLAIIVVVQVEDNHPDSISSIADANVRLDQARRPFRLEQSLFRTAAIWIGDPFPTTDYAEVVRGLRNEIEAAIDANAFAKVKSALEERLRAAKQQEASRSADSYILSLAFLYHTLGLSKIGSELILERFSRSPEGVMGSIWAFASMGNEQQAIRSSHDAFLNTNTPPHVQRLQWVTWSAIYANNEAAVQELEGLAYKPEEAFTIGFLLRALAQRHRVSDMRDVAYRWVWQGWQLPLWLIDRLIAEAMLLYATDEVHRSAAFDQLKTLQDDQTVPLIHRADIAHNLAVVRERQSARDDAVTLYQRALQLNPYLEWSRDGLGRLGAPVPPAP